MPDLSHAIPVQPWPAILETLDKIRPLGAAAGGGPRGRTSLPTLRQEAFEHPTPELVRVVLSFLVEELLTVSGCASPPRRR